MWMKIDDQLHHHRKTRKVTKSHAEKRRDAAPMGLWVLAGAWAGQNNTGGWVPAEQLDTWDDDWKALAERLVDADYWWAEERDGDPGYGFNDWFEWNTASATAAEAGRAGNHQKWHVARGIVSPNCALCPKEPPSEEERESDTRPDGDGITPRSGATRPDVAPDGPDEIADLASRSEHSRTRSGGLADPVPVPEPEPESPSATADADRGSELDRFEEFWDTYAKKVDRKKSEQKWKLALKKRGVTADMLIAAAREYVTWERANNDGGQYVMDPSKWLHNERWNDERAARSDGGTKSSGYVPQYPHASEFEPAPSGMTQEEAVRWAYEQAEKRKRNRAGGEA